MTQEEIAKIFNKAYNGRRNFLTPYNVAIGDRFKVGKKTTAKVVDIREIKSMVTGLTTGYQCIAKGEGFIATNEFEVPFSTVVRNRIVSMAELQEMAELENWDD